MRQRWCPFAQYPWKGWGGPSHSAVVVSCDVGGRGGIIAWELCRANIIFLSPAELYTDESPGLKVDPVIVLVLSLGFIFSVVALHGMFYLRRPQGKGTNSFVAVIAKLTRKFSA